MIFDIHDDDVYWCAADCGWVTGHSYIVYGPLANHTTGVLYEGAPDWPDKDRWWSIIEKYRVTILYTAPTAIRCVHAVGDGAPRQARPVVAAAAGVGRRADQPGGVGLVLEGDRRRAVPRRRHVVADRDRRDHDHAAAGVHHAEAGLRDVPVPRDRGRRRRRARRVGRARRGRVPRAAASVARDRADDLGRPRPLRRDLLLEVRARDLRRRRRRAPRRRGLLLAARPDRRRDERRRPPAVDVRDRVGARGRRARRRGGRGVEAARDQGRGDRGVRDAEGRASRATTRCSAVCATTSPR